MANANWKTCGLPKCKPHQYSEEVLVTWIPSWNRELSFVSTAIFIPHHWCTTEDISWSDECYEDLEYCEEKESWWVPDGWYETITNAIDDIGFMKIDGEVIAWDKMPKPYKPRLTDMQSIKIRG